MSVDLALADRLRDLPLEAREALYKFYAKRRGLLCDVRYDWEFWSRPDQRVSDEELEIHPVVCFTGPRGCGKSRAGIQLWLRPILAGEVRRPRIIAATEYDVEDTVVFGDSGIMACIPPGERPVWLKSDGPAGKLRFKNGIEALCFSAKVPGQLIGNQGDHDLYDDVAKWEPNIRAVWEQARVSCRLGRRTGILATTDDDYLELAEVLAVAGALVRRPADVFANRYNLAASFFEELAVEVDKDFYDAAVYGTKIPNMSPFSGINFGASPVRVLSARPDDFAEVVVAVDPSDGKGGTHDDWGIGAAGRLHDRHIVAIEDRSGQCTEDEGADAALDLCVAWGARVIVVESNRGPRVRSAIKAAFYKRIAEGNQDVPSEIPEIVGVTATDGKKLRAGPLRRLYLQGMLHHTPNLAALERQQKAWRPDGPKRPRQDDRIDWLVHAVTHLGGLSDGERPPNLDEIEGLAQRVRRIQAGGSRDAAVDMIRSDKVSAEDPRSSFHARARRPSLSKRSVL